MKKQLFHVIDSNSGRQWVVLAKSHNKARQKVLFEVQDLAKDVYSNPKEKLEIVETDEGTITEIGSRIEIEW